MSINWDDCCGRREDGLCLDLLLKAFVVILADSAIQSS